MQWEQIPEKKIKSEEIKESKEDVFGVKEKLTRRDFLKISLAAALGGAAYFWFPKLFSSAAEASELKEARKQLLDFKKECLIHLKDYSALKKEIGPENFSQLIEIIKEIDPEKINKEIADWIGISKENLDKKKISSLQILAEKDWQEAGFSAEEGALLPGGRILLRSSALLEEGKVKRDRFSHVFVHEYFHILTSNFDQLKKESVPWVPWIDKYSLPLDFYEGATELVNLMYHQRKGILPKEYGYRGGNTLTAFFISQIVGEKKFVKDYFSGNITEIERNFDQKFGAGQFKEIMYKERGVVGMLIGCLDDLDILYKIIKTSQERKIDYQKILSSARELGINERIRLIKGNHKEIEGLTCCTENFKGSLACRGVLFAKDILPYGVPYRIYLGPAGVFPSENRYKSEENNIKRYSKMIKELRNDWEERKEYNKREYNSFEEYIQVICGTFYFPINISSFIKDLLNNYELEKDLTKKEEIEQKIHQRIEVIGKNALEKIKKIMRDKDKECKI